MLSFRQENGVSYKQLAEMINSKVANYLHEYLAYRDEIDERYPEYKGAHDQDLNFFASRLTLKVIQLRSHMPNIYLACLG